LRTPPISESVFFCGSVSEQFEQTPVGTDGRENLRVLHLSGHHDLRDALALAGVDQLTQIAQ
jgi:hypothetical protein